MKLRYCYLFLSFLTLFPFAKTKHKIATSLPQSSEIVLNQALHICFFNAGKGHFTLLKQGINALIIDAGSLDKNFSDLRTTFEEHLGNAKIKAIILTHNSTHHHNFLKTLRKHYCQEDCSILSIHNQKIRLFHDQNHCEYLSPLQASDLRQLSNFLNKQFTQVLFKFPVQIAPFKAEKLKDPSLVFTLEYQNIKILFTGSAGPKQLNYLVNSKQSQENPEKAKILQENINLLSDVNVFVIPINAAQDFPLCHFIANHSNQRLTSIHFGAPFANEALNAMPNTVKNNLFSTCNSSEFPYLKIENHELFRFDFNNKKFVKIH